MKVLGIDVGGSGIKGAPVDIKTGDLLGERYRIPTPKAAKPKPIVQTITEMVKHFDWGGPIGCGFPAVVQHGVARSAAYIDNSWIGQNVEELLGEATGCPVCIINDADAAGLAEIRFGAGRGHGGVAPPRYRWNRFRYRHVYEW